MRFREVFYTYGGRAQSPSACSQAARINNQNRLEIFRVERGHGAAEKPRSHVVTETTRKTKMDATVSAQAAAGIFTTKQAFVDSATFVLLKLIVDASKIATIRACFAPFCQDYRSSAVITAGGTSAIATSAL